MTVKELIEILQTFPPDLEVKFVSTEDGMDEMSILIICKNKEDDGPLLV